MKNSVGNSLAHILIFFLLGIKSYREKRRCRKHMILRKINFFADGILSDRVLKLTITTINCVECSNETGGKTNICIG